MIFQEPKMEFLHIDLNIDASNTTSAGNETCTGPLAPSHRCDYSGKFWLDGSENDVNAGNSEEPKIVSAGRSTTKKSSTTNNGIINGFFDPMGK